MTAMLYIRSICNHVILKFSSTHDSNLTTRVHRTKTFATDFNPSAFGTARHLCGYRLALP